MKTEDNVLAISQPTMKIMEEPVKANKEIFYTNDHGMFGWIPGNRLLEERKIKKICKSHESGIHLFPYVPILVTEDHKVVDGQNRLMAAKRLKIPIYFMYIEDCDVIKIAKINSATSVWKVKDYLNCWINLHRNDYIVLEDYMNKFSIPISAAIQLLMEGVIKTGGGLMDDFKDGNFKINYHENALKIARMYNEYLVISDMNKSRLLLLAINTLSKSDKYNHEEVIQKITTTGAKIEQQSSVKDFMLHIEMLYNKGSHRRKLIV